MRESESRFRETADAAPVLIWVSDTTKACTWFNRPWLEITGRTMEQEHGFGWADSVHPDDYDRCVAIYSEAFDRREPFRMDYRLRRHDGEWRTLNDTGVPRFADGGIFLGFIGACTDVTEARSAELEAAHEALRQAQKLDSKQFSSAKHLEDRSRIPETRNHPVSTLRNPPLMDRRLQAVDRGFGDPPIG